MAGHPYQLRRQALQKIAVLSANHADTNLIRFPPSHLHNGKGTANIASTPMSIGELDVLLSLCKAGPLIDNLDTATRLLGQLSPYFSEAHAQVFAPSPFLRSIQPSPWEALSHQLGSAMLAIGARHLSLHAKAFECTISFLRNCLDSVNAITARHQHSSDSESDDGFEDFADTASISVSLLGFLEAASMYANFFHVSEQLEVVSLLSQILSEGFMVSVEGAFSMIRTSGMELLNWKSYTKRYSSIGRPLGAMLLQSGFMRFLVSCSSLLTCNAQQLQQTDVFDILTSQETSLSRPEDNLSLALLEVLSNLAIDEMRLLEDGADYLQLSSAWQQRLAFTVKSHTLCVFLNCIVTGAEAADPDLLMSWLDDAMGDPVQMADHTLASTVLKCMAVLARFSSAVASTLGRSLPRFIVQGGIQGETMTVASRSLAYILQLLSTDAVITCLYSLGNVLSPRSKSEKILDSNLSVLGNTGRHNELATGSAISLNLSGDEETAAVHSNVIHAIVRIAIHCQDEKITALALSMMLQKLGKVGLAVDLYIVTEAAALVVSGGPQELKSVLKLYSKISHDAEIQGDVILIEAVLKARMHLSKAIRSDSVLYDIYQVHLLEGIISKGDVHESDNTHQADIDLAAREIAQLLQPLTSLVASQPRQNAIAQDGNLADLYRQAWYNIVVHGITLDTELGQKYSSELQSLAVQSVPLVAEDRGDQFESDIELNSVLRRGTNAPHTAEQKRKLLSVLTRCESDIKSLSHSKVIFLNAAYMVETLRADAGTFHHILTYFLDPSLNGSAMENCMLAISEEVMSIYLKKALSGRHRQFSASSIAKQLALIFAGCCHRIPRVQQVATTCADRIITQMPSSLCQKSSLFALLELLTIMWTSCLEAETDEYSWRSHFESTRGGVSVDLSDDYELKKNTLSKLHKRAIIWVTGVINIASMDVKGLLQTYLSGCDDEAANGRVALGRSFALDMGSQVPSSDQKLGVVERHGEWNMNTASDFIAQYTNRQEFRHVDSPLYDEDGNLVGFGKKTNANLITQCIEDNQAFLGHLESRILGKAAVSIEELRYTLRRAAASVSNNPDQCAVIHHLVSIPFAVFTKQSVKLGISLWLGIVNENPQLGSIILVEIAHNWESTVRRRMGLFSKKIHNPNPFYMKEEFAPSDKVILLKRQQAVHDLMAPHLRILQFLASHFNATRLGSGHTQRVLHRLIIITLEELKSSTAHPLAREGHFQIILFSLKILKHSTELDYAAKWRLKNMALSAGLAWFCHQPKWSFGGNRLQLKAETRLMEDVGVALRAVSSTGLATIDTLHSLGSKQELLLALLDHEQMRLDVWLYPLGHERRHIFSALHYAPHFGKPNYEASEQSQQRSEGKTYGLLGIYSSHLQAAWLEHPGLAIHLSARFQSTKLRDEVRSLLSSYPERALDEPDALKIMLGSNLEIVTSHNLKYLLYWTAVNPVSAVTYFLPEFKNDPFIIQYAMRALESHSVDVTFFYVPQIVQALRYDKLGYVQRYIIETAKFSQLFAHQIIWNMKANAYKDEDSSIEDALKPTLDLVTNNMIQSFSKTDRAFYEREFSFFNEITDISGKLRPFIKKSKSEKKQKIEEELRKIKVEVGVYLPSNPEGTVIGIDRKSGKPLQSHAKAPYMATFRIMKNRGDMESVDDMLENTNRNIETHRNGPVTQESTYEVWQSAIFKVGDDCRQDVLALQLIAAFRGIFNNVGLDVYVYPYRVTATAPGCGVIDVLPNSLSRDMLGREAVNGLYDYFVSKYGAESSIKFQEARNNFVKSMAAYSVISYLLQFKDRHNGNIMIDSAGHILHIDFGFCFDIAPGGIRFERAPFKLTSEMVAVMGGSTTSQSYKWFEELCVKAFLASRQHTKELCDIVLLMLGSGLPCFKPETLQHLRERFVLERSEREAADFMMDLIKKSYSSSSTLRYDQFQLWQNGIPY